MYDKELLSKKERDNLDRLFNIISGEKKQTPSEDDLYFIMNNVSPAVDSLKKVMVARLVSLGVEKLEAEVMLDTISKLSHVAGGITFADFTVTESLSRAEFGDE